MKSGLTEDGQAIHAGMNITPYQSEQRAYGVTNSILNSAMNPVITSAVLEDAC